MGEFIVTSAWTEAATPAAAAAASADKPSLLGDYMELSKARLASLVLFTLGVGYLLAAQGPIRWGHFAAAVIGTALVVFGANAFNQWWEFDRDALMRRTARRPLPGRRFTRAHAFGFAVVTSAAGLTMLATLVNATTTILALVAELVYVLAYTPLKTRTTANTLVGAISGAIPPMIGWAAVTGRLDAEAWLLGGILFVWQIPHSLALAWMYRDDYERGGFRMLAVVDPTGQSTSRLLILYSAALLPLGMALTLTGVTGWTFLAGSLALGAGLIVLGARFRRERSRTHARRVFLATVIYLPLLLGLMVADRNSQTSAGVATNQAHRATLSLNGAESIETITESRVLATSVR